MTESDRSGAIWTLADQVAGTYHRDGVINRIDPIAAGYKPEDAPSEAALHEDFLPRSLDDALDAAAEDDQDSSPLLDLELVPAFVVGQLHEAFRMGFAIFLPFLLLDMLVAGVLLSLGMHMLSPSTVSLPFKLLLFALLDGWSLIGANLLGQYL